MTRARKQPDAVALELAKQLIAQLGGSTTEPANDDEPTPEEAEKLRELARQDAEEMRRARRR